MTGDERNPDAREIAELPAPEAPEKDGILEEDNAIPLWFNLGFYGMIAFGIVYMAWYTLSGWSQVDQYRAELEVAAERYAAVRAALPSENPFRGDTVAIAEGEQLWATTCQVCHKPDGSGLVGPSLVDPYWKYGSADADLYESVADGRPLGMPPWGATLGGEKIWKVLAYLETLPKSDQPGVGAPEAGTGS